MISGNEKISSTVKNRINSYVFSFQSDVKHNIEFGYIEHVKTKVTLAHKPFNVIFDKQLSYVHLRYINPPIQYYVGAMLASECIKAITHKYYPFNQSYTFTFDKELLNMSTITHKLNQLKIFIVGAGAIGCELLKNLAALQCNNVSITDPDHIELSNLSRQFLFRNDDIGKSKSRIANSKITEYNPMMKITSYEDKLCSTNQQFVDTHFSKYDIIFNALDNVEARLYVDSQCVIFKKPLFESGTMGTTGNVQPIIPFVTESYGASRDRSDDVNYPVCTIKNFPTRIQHTIHYAIDDFNSLFVEQPCGVPYQRESH